MTSKILAIIVIKVFVQDNIIVTLICRLRSKGNQASQNSSEQYQTYENTRGFDNPGVGLDTNTVPSTSEYETPEHTPQYGKCTVYIYII